MDDVRLLVKADIEELGFTDVCVDVMPDENSRPEVVGFFEWTNPKPVVTGGGSWHYIQVQVRSRDPVKARNDCARIAKHLDSGPEETQFHLPDYIIYRPRRGAILLARSNKTTTYSAELSVWCND